PLGVEVAEQERPAGLAHQLRGRQAHAGSCAGDYGHALRLVLAHLGLPPNGAAAPGLQTQSDARRSYLNTIAGAADHGRRRAPVVAWGQKAMQTFCASPAAPAMVRASLIWSTGYSWVTRHSRS